MTSAFTHAKNEPRTAEQWWELVGKTLTPSRRFDPSTGSTANAALIMCSYVLAGEVVDELVRAGANLETLRVAVGQVRTLPEGGEVLGVELHLPGPAGHAQLLMIPTRAILPVYRWDDRDLGAAEPIITITAPGAVDGGWVDPRQLAGQLLQLLDVTPPPAVSE